MRPRLLESNSLHRAKEYHRCRFASRNRPSGEFPRSSTEMILASNSCILVAQKLPAACNISIGSTHKQIQGTRLMRVSSPIVDGYGIRRDSRVAYPDPWIQSPVQYQRVEISSL
jgi:hypothetical protein